MTTDADNNAGSATRGASRGPFRAAVSRRKFVKAAAAGAGFAFLLWAKAGQAARAIAVMRATRIFIGVRPVIHQRGAGVNLGVRLEVVAAGRLERPTCGL